MRHGETDYDELYRTAGAERAYREAGGEDAYRSADEPTSIMQALRNQREDGWADGALALQQARAMSLRYCLGAALIACPLIAMWLLLPVIAAVIMTVLLSVALAWWLQRLWEKFPRIRREYHH
jgi:Flp pilus assembly protein TadB